MHKCGKLTTDNLLNFSHCFCCKFFSFCTHDPCEMLRPVIFISLSLSVASWTAYCGWLYSTVGRTSVVGWRTSLSYPRLAAEGWPFMWVNRPLQVSQLGQLSLYPFGVDKLSNEQLYRMCAGGAIWWVLTRLSQVRFINRWAPFVASSLPLNHSVYSAALHGGC